tara:strand:- start:144 stop:461 length:318 start_codon:yes stop_codon:yes gene_type:complete
MDKLDHIKQAINRPNLTKSEKIEIIQTHINDNSKSFLQTLVDRKIINSIETAVEDLHENNFSSCADDTACKLILQETVVWLRAKSKEDAVNLRFDMDFHQGAAMA